MNHPDTSHTQPDSLKGGGAMGGNPSKTDSPAQAASAAASSVADEAKRRADDALTTGIDRGAENLKSVAGAVEDASKRLREESPDSVAAQLSDYCVDAARRASEFAEGLRGRSLDDLASDVRGIARNNPAVFVAGSIAIGFALSRFLRASSSHRPNAGASRSMDDQRDGRSAEDYGGAV